MRLDDGVFCFERRVGKFAPVGRSPRYTLMVELGLLRAQAAGYAVPFDLDELHAVAWRELEAGELTPGDIGLMLWIDARRDGGGGAELADRLEAALAANGGLGARLGMELGWIVTGLAHHVAAGGSRSGARLLSEALDQLLVNNRAPSCLVPPFRRRRMAATLPELRDPDLLRLGPRGGRAPRSRPSRASGRDGNGGPPSRDTAPGWRLAVALRRRARDRRRALRDLFGSSRRDGADGVARAFGGMPRPSLARRCRARAMPGSTAATNLEWTWSIAPPG